MATPSDVSNIESSKIVRDAHLQKVIKWHFSEDTGSPFWLAQKEVLGFNPIERIKTLDDLIEHFPTFDGDNHLRNVPAAEWHPRGFANCEAWSMFMTGGTTGDPKRRWGRIGNTPNDSSDYAWDYTTFSETLPKEGFPMGGSCLYIGPGGPRRLPRGVEILARIRGAGFNVIDMDVAWMKNPKNSCEDAYKDELVTRAIGALKRDKPNWIFCPPVLIEAISERIDWTTTSVKGVFAGGTEMKPEAVRNIMEELFKGKIHFIPTYGNALVGLASPRTISTYAAPIEGQRPYSIIYQPLQPRTVLRITKPGEPNVDVPYGKRGRVEITTLSFEWFMPRFVERDEAERVAPTERYPWDGVCEVGPPEELRGTTRVGVY